MPTVEEIKTAIIDREADLAGKFQKELIVPRELTSHAESMLSTDVALVITGPRRCGKSILAFMLGQGKKSAYVSFEDERLIMPAHELNKVMEAVYSLKGEVDILIFDEIQNITGWEIFVSRLLAGRKVILTGSNAQLLSSELATHLTGRHMDITLLPFSFREFLAANGIAADNARSTMEMAKIKDLFSAYLERGGFPLAFRLGAVFLSEAYQDIIEKDAIRRYKIRRTSSFRELAKYLLSNASNEISFNKLKSIFGLKSPHTVKDYISYLSSTYMIFLLERFSFKLKEQIIAPKKVYCIDNGLIDCIGFRVSQNKGRAMENLVAIELFRRASRNKNLRVYYWKDHQQREVDFVVKEGQKITQLIQSTAVSSKKELNEREVASLLKASTELKCGNLLVLTHGYSAEEKIEGKKITFAPLWKWLLS